MIQEKDFSVTFKSFAHSRVSNFLHHSNLCSSVALLQNFISAFANVLKKLQTLQSFRISFSFSET
jgi:hypothetical protein